MWRKPSQLEEKSCGVKLVSKNASLLWAIFCCPYSVKGYYIGLQDSSSRTFPKQHTCLHFSKQTDYAIGLLSALEFQVQQKTNLHISTPADLAEKHTWIHFPWTSSSWKKLLRSTPRCLLIQNLQNQRRLRSPLAFEWPAQSGAGQMNNPPNCLVEFFTLREIQSRGHPSPRSSCLAASAGVVVWWCVHQWHAALNSRVKFLPQVIIYQERRSAGRLIHFVPCLKFFSTKLPLKDLCRWSVWRLMCFFLCLQWASPSCIDQEPPPEPQSWPDRLYKCAELCPPWPKKLSHGDNNAGSR